MTVSEHRELVTALLALDGVADAAVEGEGGDPGTLRLQLDPGADEVAVATAVNRLLRSRFGLAVDADRVRVLEESAPARPAGPTPVVPNGATNAPAAAAVPAPAPEPVRELPDVRVAAPGRLSIQRVQLVSAGLGVVVTVTLRLEGRDYSGESDGAATTTGVHRSVATATLHAVESVLGRRVRFEVEHVEIASAAGERTALVVLTLVTERGSERLSGASVVREDMRQAVIRATLAAVNRRIETMIGA
ncbi:MAG: hypothetical protein QOJ60_389 [Actinomycetota bacterium]|nr:hypothetical protein [Actinomycetota bacterium]